MIHLENPHVLFLSLAVGLGIMGHGLAAFVKALDKYFDKRMKYETDKCLSKLLDQVGSPQDPPGSEK